MIAVGAQMPDRRQVAAALGAEHVLAIAAEELRGAFQEEAFRRGQDAAQREPGVV